MWKTIKKWFSKKEEIEHRYHDWEVVERSKIFFRVVDGFYVGHWQHVDEEAVEWGHKLHAEKKVCLKCGECVDEEEYAENYIESLWDREELAEKMWQDCKR